MKFPSEKEIEDFVEEKVLQSIDISDFSLENMRKLVEPIREAGYVHPINDFKKNIKYAALDGNSFCEIEVDGKNYYYYKEFTRDDLRDDDKEAVSILEEQGFQVEFRGGCEATTRIRVSWD